MPDILSFLPLRCEDLLPFLCFYVTENLMSFVSDCLLEEKKKKHSKKNKKQDIWRHHNDDDKHFPQFSDVSYSLTSQEIISSLILSSLLNKRLPTRSHASRSAVDNKVSWRAFVISSSPDTLWHIAASDLYMRSLRGYTALGANSPESTHFLSVRSQ